MSPLWPRGTHAAHETLVREELGVCVRLWLRVPGILRRDVNGTASEWMGEITMDVQGVIDKLSQF